MISELHEPGLILIVIDAILIPKWVRNSGNKSLAIVLICLNIGLSVVGDATIASSVLAIALWILYRLFSMRACLIVAVFLLFSLLIQHFYASGTDWEFISSILFLAWFLVASEFSAKREQKLAVEKERTAFAQMLHDGLG